MGSSQRGSTYRWRSIKKHVSVTELLGFLMGVVGVSLTDCMMMTPTEAEAVCKAYNEQAEQQSRDAWNRMRLLACITVQPHTKKKMKPKELLSFPWDEDEKPKAEIVSKEEDRRQFEETLKKARLCGAIE